MTFLAQGAGARPWGPEQVTERGAVDNAEKGQREKAVDEMGWVNGRHTRERGWGMCMKEGRRQKQRWGENSK